MINAVHFKVVIFCMTVTIAHCYAPGYSFSKFSGPVSGPEKEITVDDGHHGHKVDYVAKPDYHFAYGVEDPKSHVSQSRHETRDGDAVHGEYSVLDPDGTLRTVKYTADDHNGFQAQVLLNGKPQDHASPPQQHYPASESDDGGQLSQSAGDDEESGSDEDEDGDYYKK